MIGLRAEHKSPKYQPRPVLRNQSRPFRKQPVFRTQRLHHQLTPARHRAIVKHKPSCYTIELYTSKTMTYEDHRPSLAGDATHLLDTFLLESCVTNTEDFVHQAESRRED